MVELQHLSAVAVQADFGSAGSVAVVTDEIHAWLCGFWCWSQPSPLSPFVPLLLSPLPTRLKAWLQWLRSAAKASQTAGLILPAFRSRLQTSLKWRLGLPAGLDPVKSSPQSMSLGILPSSTRVTWPSQRNHLWLSKANFLGTPARARTSLFGTQSWQVMTKILLWQCRWKVFSLHSWDQTRYMHLQRRWWVTVEHPRCVRLRQRCLQTASPLLVLSEPQSLLGDVQGWRGLTLLYCVNNHHKKWN